VYSVPSRLAEVESSKAVREHRARVAKAKQIDAGPILTASEATAPHEEIKLPPPVVQLDDIGTITKRKVPVIRPIEWDVWDRNAPTFNYESLGMVMRNSFFPGRLRASSHSTSSNIVSLQTLCCLIYFYNVQT